MDRLPMKTSLISIAAAALLFAVAFWFEDESRWMPAAPHETEMNPERPSGVRGPLRTTSAAENCERSERMLQQSVAAARHCESDDDCTLFDYGYPIQCLTSVAKSEITNLRLEYRRYELSCEFRVYYDCPTDGMDRNAVCRQNQCTVEFESIDGLTEETLEHLGIER